jgi:hypothetical protein
LLPAVRRYNQPAPLPFNLDFGRELLKQTNHAPTARIFWRLRSNRKSPI